ncbi:hypothetical protein ACFXHA_39660 [Nocardia sp. NPDC059240]|uniref:hypothetical protein n=1 Tax=Nocardia sp. NPDC059240 TaxID=3346786 RepID=UPI0036B49758
MTDSLAVATWPAPQRSLRTWDVVLGWVLYAFAVPLGMFTAYITVFFAFAADSCSSGVDCAYAYVDWGIWLSWGGTAFALISALVMLLISTFKGWLMWYWPVLSMAMIIASFVGGAFLAGQEAA